MLRRFFRFAVRSVLARSGRNLGQHRHLQLYAGPQLGHARLGRKLRRRWRLRHCRSCGRLCAWYSEFRDCEFRYRQLGHRRLGWRRRNRRLGWGGHVRQSEALALHFVALDHRLTQVLHLHVRRFHRCGRTRRSSRRRHRRPRRRHRNNACLFLYVIKHDGLLRNRIGDHATLRRVNPRLAIAGTPHARRGLSRRSARRGLRLGGTLRARWRHRRRSWQCLRHSGLSLARRASCSYPWS